MKILIYFLACTVFILGCQNENYKVIEPSSLTNDPYITSNGFEAFVGTIEFKVSKNENLIFFNLGEENQKLFYLQTPNLEQLTSSGDMGEVFVNQDENMIIVSSNSTEDVVIFTISDISVPVNLFPNRSVKIISGYGIGEAWGDGILELYQKADLISIFGPKESTRAGSSCDAGGSGSTYCSVQSSGQNCSVNCNSGYYACCNINTSSPYVSCNCEPDGDPDQRIQIVSN